MLDASVDATFAREVAIRGCDVHGTESTGVHLNDWYALQVRGRREKSIARRYRDLGLNSWLPLYRTDRKWSDRVVRLERPLIAGYVFVQTDARSVAELVRMEGVFRVVGSISNEEINTFQRTLAAAADPRPCSFEPGATVTVKRGPMAGQTGTVLRVKNEVRLVLSIEMLNRHVSVELDLDTLQ
jgi:transcriptional antiterminator RfaH